jgi:hypothetical protein
LDEYEVKMKPVYDAIVAKFQVDVFGADAKTSKRADAVAKLGSSASHYLKADKLKETVAEQKKALKLESLTLSKEQPKDRNIF